MKKRTAFYPLALVIISGLNCCSEPDPIIYQEIQVVVEVILPRVPSQEDTIQEDTITIPETNPDLRYGSLTDIEGNIYKTVQLFDKVWMAENLRTTMYNDSSVITRGEGAPAGYTDWFDLIEGAYCWYDNDPMSPENQGALYNWRAVGTGKLCPTGWHVPGYDEWVELIVSTGGWVEDFNLKSENARITWGQYADDFKNGLHGCLDGWGFIQCGCWWSSTPMGLSAYLLNENYFGFEPACYGFSVRCVKD